MIKIGHTIHLHERFQKFKTQEFCNSKQFKILYIIAINPPDLRKEIESDLHRIFKDNHDFKEFYSPELTELDNVIHRIIAQNPQQLSLLTRAQINEILGTKSVKVKNNQNHTKLVQLGPRVLDSNKPKGRRLTVWSRLHNIIIPMITTEALTVNQLISKKLEYSRYDTKGHVASVSIYSKKDLTYDVQHGYLQYNGVF